MELNAEQIKKIRELGFACNLRFVILHGSYAKKTPQKDSDLDIAVLGRDRISADERSKLYDVFSDIFGDNEKRELDLKTLSGVDPLFRYEVTKDGALLYGDPTDYEEFKIYAYKDYMDSYDLRELESILLRKSINSLASRYDK